MFVQFILLLILFSFHTLIYAQELTLPAPGGIYGVGIVTVELCDPARTQLRSTEKRRWMAAVFLPQTQKQQHLICRGPLMMGMYWEQRF